MAFVNTQPAAISAAATQLEGLANSFAAESSAAASSTTDVMPAATDEVSILQAGVFSTYGQLYQSVSAQAEAIHQQFVQLLNQSSGSYQDTESANQAGAAANSLSNATGSASSAAAQPAQTLAGLISGITTTLSGSVLNSNITNLANVQVGNYASAASDVVGVTSGGLLTALTGPAAAASSDIGGLGTALAGDVGPAAGAAAGGGIGAAPVLASAGAGSSIGPMSVPPSWAGGAGAGIPAGSAPVTLASQSFAAGAPTAGGVPTNGIAGMPAVANGGRGSGSSFGAPRYGVKPKVMPSIAKPV
jgi:hypothetical protein